MIITKSSFWQQVLVFAVGGIVGGYAYDAFKRHILREA